MRAAVWVVIETAGLHSLFISVHSSAPTTRPRWINLNKGNRGSVKRCDRRQHREQLRIWVKPCAASNFFLLLGKLWGNIRKPHQCRLCLDNQRGKGTLGSRKVVFCWFVPHSCVYLFFFSRALLIWLWYEAGFTLSCWQSFWLATDHYGLTLRDRLVASIRVNQKGCLDDVMLQFLS